jgi:hypothetical protein
MFDSRSVLGGDTQNWMSAILAPTTLVGPPAALEALCSNTSPSTISESSMVPPPFFTIRMSRRSTRFPDSEVPAVMGAPTSVLADDPQRHHEVRALAGQRCLPAYPALQVPGRAPRTTREVSRGAPPTSVLADTGGEALADSDAF